MKPAHLTGTLLPRKGLASPARSTPPVGPPVPGAPLLRHKPAPPDAVQPPPRPSTARRVEPGRRDQGPDSLDARRVHLSLRLDLARHRRLKLVAKQGRRTMQSLLVQALDELFDRHASDANEGLRGFVPRNACSRRSGETYRTAAPGRVERGGEPSRSG